MEALSRIDHPGVVGVLDTGLTAEGKQFLVMQYIEGQTLRSAIGKGGVSLQRAATIIRQIGQALAAAHEKGVWHRDLKPANIMLQTLGGEDHVKLIDFGIAGIQDSQFSGEKTQVAGTLSYMAPEQLSGHPCAASDTYALGVVAHEILTGALPGNITESQPKLPEAAERSIHKAMSLNPGARQSSVRELGEELYRGLSGSDTARKSSMSAIPGAVEMAHILFTDLVGYSLLPMDRQKTYLAEFQRHVRESPQFRASEAAGDIISLPTGDGMALAFFGDPTAPAQCAREVAVNLRAAPHLKLRMGIHSGPVYRVADVNANANVAGGGINLAQRVMDCGDAGHILISKTVADVLLQLSPWAPHLIDLGECKVKHGVTVHLYNLATADWGNPANPKSLAATPRNAYRKLTMALGGMLMAAALAGIFWFKGSNQIARDERSIAVLPFVDMSPGKNEEWFSQGMAEELLNGLSRVPGLRVAARTSAFQFKDQSQDVRQIGQKLRVANILEGSVQKLGNRAKISTQLIKVSDGFQMWSESYDRELTDIFQVQHEIAQSVTGALQLKLMGAASRTAGPSSAQAYDSYLMGRYFLGKSNRENLEKAVVHFKETVQLDPKYAPAWVGLGASKINQAGSAFVPPEEGYKEARAAVETALSLDGNLGEAHSALGWLQMLHDLDWTAADKSIQKALLLDPGNAVVVSHAGILARIVGRLDEAARLGRRAMMLDPMNTGVLHNAGVSLYYAGHYQESISAYRKALEIFPEFEREHCFIGLNYLMESRPKEALAEIALERNPVFRVFGLSLANYALGNKSESDLNLAELAKHEMGYQVAQSHAFRGEPQLAFEWLERAAEARSAGLAQLKGDPLMKSLVPDQRYQALLKKMALK